MTETEVQALHAEIQQLTDAVESLSRAIQGAEEEGNLGILGRLAKVERRQTIMWSTFPIAITGGTALGQMLSRWFGIL